jgi:hypothetical protein
MSLKNWLKQDNILLGFFLAIAIPVPAALFFAAVLRLIQVNFHVLGRTRDIDILLLGLAVNLIAMRFYMVKFRLENTGKGILVLTVIMMILFFLFLKNSNFAFPF